MTDFEKAFNYAKNTKIPNRMFKAIFLDIVGTDEPHIFIIKGRYMAVARSKKRAYDVLGFLKQWARKTESEVDEISNSFTQSKKQKDSFRMGNTLQITIELSGVVKMRTENTISIIREEHTGNIMSASEWKNIYKQYGHILE